MTDEYVPEYAKGQILVEYKDGLGFSFANFLGNSMGFPPLYSWDYGTNVIVHKIPEGREIYAIGEFQKYPQFIEWAERRDLKLESRWQRIEICKRLLEDVDCEHLSDKKFNEEVSRILD